MPFVVYGGGKKIGDTKPLRTATTFVPARENWGKVAGGGRKGFGPSLRLGRPMKVL